MFRTIQERVDDKLFPFKTKEKSTANSPYFYVRRQDIKKLDESKKHAEQGLCRRADDIVADMRTKYGL